MTLLQQLQKHCDSKAVFVGIGSEFRGDDAVGVVIVNRLAELTNPDCSLRFLFINGGCAPENILGEIRAFQPETIVFIDAAVLGEPPGTVQLLDTRDVKIAGISFCTHTLPLPIIADYIQRAVPCRIILICVEPENMEFRPDCELAPSVAKAADEVVQAIAALAGL